jgi:hypothetical protein
MTVQTNRQSIYLISAHRVRKTRKKGCVVVAIRGGRERERERERER